MRWFTCTPVAFGGGPDFFARDSGLLCRGFQELGIESRAVMPGDPTPDDESDLIRTPYPNLESPEWWKSHDLDGVVLYAWGSPGFRRVAAAIHHAGIRLVLNQDNGGLVSPLAGFLPWLEEQWILSGSGRGVPALLRFAGLTLRGLGPGLLRTDPLRRAHLRHGDVIACVSPKAAACYRRLCRFYGGRGMAERVKVIPHSVEPLFRFQNGGKSKRIVCVGRWDDFVQKRPDRLATVLGGLLEEDPSVTISIVGKPSLPLRDWHQALPAPVKQRCELHGPLDRKSLAALLHDSWVFYSPSAYESFGIAAAEALCSGCSVVAGRSVSMASFEWFVSEDSGTLADGPSTQSHLAALRSELRAWENKQRQPEQIAAVWGARLHAREVAAAVLAEFDASPGS
ncbi:MAG: glycosyltransferase family 4 protein [Verrucomicrobiales bacterium]|nr:glycosyltransferase family 4 protein [Verrucomicrobiota bacterium JB025]